MRKTCLILFTFVLILSFTHATAATKWTENPHKIVGGQHLSDATYISDSNYVRVLEVSDNPAWYYIEAPTNGTYYFTATPLGELPLEMKLHSEKGDFIESLSFPKGKTTTNSYENVKAKTRIYIEFVDTNSWYSYTNTLIICFDGYHQHSNEISLLTEPSCVDNGTYGETVPIIV